MIGLYIHIPFCKHICKYCDFPKKIPKDSTQIEKYLEKIKLDILKYQNLYDKIDTIYIGGGTPNSLSNCQLEDLLKFIYELKINYKEFTIEINPEILTATQALLFKKYGVNRISIGAETFSDYGLKHLGRHHTKNDIINAVNLLKKNELYNINIDLIFGYYGQTLEDFKEDLNYYTMLNVSHLSCYSLIVEENTLLNIAYKNIKLDEDLIADMYDYLLSFMREKNYVHYEISNFARNGFESLHNLKYWDKDEYIGIGMGATSYIEHKRITNSLYINKYLRDEDLYVENLTELDEKKEMIIMGLRKMTGISKIKYLTTFKSRIEDDFSYQKLIQLGLLEEDNNFIKLTEKGYLLSNIVFEEFI